MNIHVRRDQFNITPQGIVHKPTDAAVTPYPGDPYSGITRLGQLGCKHPNGNSFRPEDVQRMMWELWVEYVIGNPQLFESAELRCAHPACRIQIGRDSQIQFEGRASSFSWNTTAVDQLDVDPAIRTPFGVLHRQFYHAG